MGYTNICQEVWPKQVSPGAIVAVSQNYTILKPF